MFGSGLGFVLEQPGLSGSGGGGGGGQTLAIERVELVQTVAFTAGSLSIALANVPLTNGLTVFYNGVKLRPGSGGYTLVGSTITIQFDDDPTIYDTGNVIFEAYNIHP